VTWTGEAVVSAAAVILTIYLKHRDDKKERAAVAQAIRDRDQKLTFVLKEYKPHAHEEKEKGEALTTDGLRYPNVTINGS
jgi:hypothetical protein